MGRLTRKGHERWVWLAALLATLLHLVWTGAASAAEGVVVIAAGEAMQVPMARARVEALLGKAGYRKISWWAVDDLEDQVHMVPFVDLRSNRACGAAVQVEDWVAQLEAAHESLQLLDVDGALASLAELDLELACLAGVPRRQDLFLLGLVGADAHRLAAAAEREAGLQFFHRGESEYALRMAATFAPDLPPPAWLDPGLGDLLAAIQASYSLDDAVPTVFWGEGRGLWVDGVQIGTGARVLSPGRHLVQSAPLERVEAGGLLEAASGDLLLVQVTPGSPPLMPADMDLALYNLAAGEGDAPILNQILSLLGKGGNEPLIAAELQDGLHLWGRGANNLTMRYPGSLEEEIRKRNTNTAPVTLLPTDVGPEPMPEVERATLHAWRVGVGPAMWFSGLGDAPLEGLGGLAGGFALSARRSLGRQWALAGCLQPVARVQALPAGYDSDWIVRAMIPGRLGVRLGAPRDRASLEVGADLGLDYLGRFEKQELRGFVALAGGLALPLRTGVSFNLEVWGGSGLGWPVGGLQIVLAVP